MKLSLCRARAGALMVALVVLMSGLMPTLIAPVIEAQDQHWSRQFKFPGRGKPMLPGTGIQDGGGSPTMTRVKWHDGKLWMSGAWEPGLQANNFTKRYPNEYWYLWSWSPETGWEVVCWFHSSKGGAGPNGKIFDFEFLPDGRLVVVGSFTELDNPGGHKYHRVNALGIYDPKEPSANKWKPLGSLQYNGTVSSAGSIYSVEYDPQGNDLYVGGTFGGIPNKGNREHRSPFIHKYDFDTESWEPMTPSVGGAKPIVHRIFADTSTTPSTIYVGGKFHYAGGNGYSMDLAGSTSNWSVGFAKYKEGEGWTPYPTGYPRGLKPGKSGILQRAADFARFDSVQVLDFLVDDADNNKETPPDLWIVGAFSEGTEYGGKLRGIAKWDYEKKQWIDPTGKGGVGREVFSIGKAENGKIYFGGAFGGYAGTNKVFRGFMDGTRGSLAISYDPATGEWKQLGAGLASGVFPEVRMAINGNDVYYVGDFSFIGAGNKPGAKGPAEWSSHRIARWNETIDFTKEQPKVAAANDPGSNPYIPKAPTAAQSTGNEHWSRAFAPPASRQPMTGKTGHAVGFGTPDITGMAKLGDTIFFVGNYPVKGERWYVWSYHPTDGWAKLAWEARGKSVAGVDSKPEGCKIVNGKLYVYGAIANWNGIGIYDPKGPADIASRWSKLTGTFRGKEVYGNAMTAGDGPINDIWYDEKNQDLYMIGSTGLELDGVKFPKDVARVIRIDKDGVYHPMGHMLKAEDPGKPVTVLTSLLVDNSVSPADVYVGGTFNYNGMVPTSNKSMVYNMAKYDHEKKDWVGIGKGNFMHLKEIDSASYPEGLPGLPARPGRYANFMASGFPRIRDILMDKEGNLYVGGTLAVVDNTVPVKDRKESFGIAKYDKAQDKWVAFTTAGGVSRDIHQMTWIDEEKTKMLITGSFLYDEQYNLLGNVAVLDVTTGELKPLGGGLLRGPQSWVVGSMVRHIIDGDDWYFAGGFDHAGVNANDSFSAAIPSSYLAMYNATKNMDPNRGLVLKAVEGYTPPTGFSSASVKVPLEAELTEGEGTITWYERRSNGQFAKKGTGPKYTANIRVRADTGDVFYYVTVTRPDGVEGGKVPVRIPAKK